MAFDFPVSPTQGQVYTDPVTGLVYTFDGVVWSMGGGGVSGASPYVLKAGDAMLGFLSLVGPPTAALHATTKQYTDELVAAESLFQGVWNVASNTPDLTPAVMAPLHSYSWIAQTVDPAVPETALASLPGIGGKSIAATDTIVWNNTLSIYEQIRGAVSVSQLLISDAPPATAFHGQQWWDSDSGKIYTYYDDGTSQQWIQTSGGGGANKAEVYFGDTAPAPTFSGELWWDTSTGNMMINQAGTWVQTNVEEAPLDGGTYARSNAGWVASASGGGGGLDQATADLRYLQLTGGTLTGNLTVSRSTAEFTINAVGVNYSSFNFKRDGNKKFDFQLLGGTGEPHNLAMWSYDDAQAGAKVLEIGRANRIVDFTNRPTVAGAPIVMQETVDTLLARIDALEARLAKAKL